MTRPRTGHVPASASPAASPSASTTAPATAPAPSRFRALWGRPIALGLLTIVGLASALFSDGGLGDWLAWVTLGIPTLGCVWWGLRRGPPADRA